MTTTTTASTTSIPVPTRAFQTLPGDHRFFSTMSIVTAVTILAGFSNVYVPRLLGDAPAVPWIIHLHAVVFTSWLIFYVTQTTLVLTGRTAMHRRIGIAGVVLAAVGVFATLVGAGWYVRRNLQGHKRLMLMATASALVGLCLRGAGLRPRHTAACAPVVFLQRPPLLSRDSTDGAAALRDRDLAPHRVGVASLIAARLRAGLQADFSWWLNIVRSTASLPQYGTLNASGGSHRR